MTQMIGVLEVTIVTLALFSICVKKKHSWKTVIATLLLFTICLFVLGVVVIKSLGIYGNGNALFTLFGFCYLIPLKYLFKGITKDHFYITLN